MARSPAVIFDNSGILAINAGNQQLECQDQNISLSPVNDCHFAGVALLVLGLSAYLLSCLGDRKIAHSTGDGRADASTDITLTEQLHMTLNSGDINAFSTFIN